MPPPERVFGIEIKQGMRDGGRLKAIASIEEVRLFLLRGRRVMLRAALPEAVLGRATRWTYAAEPCRQVFNAAIRRPL